MTRHASLIRYYASRLHHGRNVVGGGHLGDEYLAFLNLGQFIRIEDKPRLPDPDPRRGTQTLQLRLRLRSSFVSSWLPSQYSDGAGLQEIEGAVVLYRPLEVLRVVVVGLELSSETPQLEELRRLEGLRLPESPRYGDLG